MLTNHKENLISIAKVNDKAARTTVVDCPTQPSEKYERTQYTPRLNEKIDSGKTHLQDLARWWRTSQGVDIPKISQFLHYFDLP